MKKTLAAVVLLCAVAGFAQDLQFGTRSWSAWNNPKKIKYQKDVTPEAVKITVDESDASNASNLQIWCGTSALKANGKYQVEFTVKSSEAFQIPVSVMLSDPPFSAVSTKNISVEAGTPIDVAMQFTMPAVLGKFYRVPCLSLGKAPFGSEITLSPVKIIEVK